MGLMQPISATSHPYANGSYKQMLIDGKWVDAQSGKKFETHNPATGELLATVAEGDAKDIDLAVAAARRAFEGPWAKAKPFERQALLLKFADLVEKHFDELALLDTLDMGAPVSRTFAGKQRILGMLRFYAGQATLIYGETIENSLPGQIFSYTLKEPVGVVGAIIPWNSPLSASVWKIGPAIATGCTVVLKPAEEAPLTSLRLGELALEAGFPAGVINVVPGYGETAGAALASHQDVNKVAFTGSHFTGQSIIRASAGNLKRVSLELGGKSPNIVFADADLEDRVAGSVRECFNNSGQSCDAPTRMLVERSVYDKVVEIAERTGKEARVGNPEEEGEHIGPLVSHIQFGRVQALIEAGVAEGARLLVGGPGKPDGYETGYFVKPTIFADVNNTMRIAREEVFGPVLSIIPFDTEEEAIAIANDTAYGLAAYVQTGDPDRAERVSARLRAGMVHINGGPHRYGSPFGGYKQSGNGREGGMFGLEDFLEIKTVHRPEAA